MKVVAGEFGWLKSFWGRLPTHGVYHLQQWELLDEHATEVSLHWTFESAMAAAAREEAQHCQCVVVCFDYSAKECEATPSNTAWLQDLTRRINL
jgi:transcriptional regulator GlxA family with amidase domain